MTRALQFCVMSNTLFSLILEIVTLSFCFYTRLASLEGQASKHQSWSIDQRSSTCITDRPLSLCRAITMESECHHWRLCKHGNFTRLLHCSKASVFSNAGPSSKLNNSATPPLLFHQSSTGKGLHRRHPAEKLPFIRDRDPKGKICSVKTKRVLSLQRSPEAWTSPLRGARNSKPSIR